MPIFCYAVAPQSHPATSQLYRHGHPRPTNKPLPHLRTIWCLPMAEQLPQYTHTLTPFTHSIQSNIVPLAVYPTFSAAVPATYRGDHRPRDSSTIVYSVSDAITERPQETISRTPYWLRNYYRSPGLPSRRMPMTEPTHQQYTCSGREEMCSSRKPRSNTSSTVHGQDLYSKRRIM